MNATPTASPTTSTSAAPVETLSAKELAGAAKADRNRAIDLYRAVAMLAVALGHWAAIAVGVDAAGDLFAGNALEYNPSMAWMSWFLQVMPLFFVVGGFSSAMSLDSHNKAGGRSQDWVAARLRRMVAPAIVLAGTWLVLIAGGFALGQGALITVGATAAAIPLWFLSNYTIDTAIAPYVLPLFRRNPRLFTLGGLSVFGLIEAARFADVPVLPHFNWVLGWLLFQVAGFAWRDDLLPQGRRMFAIAAGLWTLAISAVAFGPWPVAMVHFPGLENSPTHPPSLALLLFGSAYSATAIAAAPAISKWLAGNAKAWTAVVAANAIALSVYLWHFTAAIAASAVLYALGVLPTADVGTAAWWVQKLPLMALSTVILAGIVALVNKFERRALLAPRTTFNGGQAQMLAVAAVLSACVKLWANGSITELVVGCSVLLVLWFTKLAK